LEANSGGIAQLDATSVSEMLSAATVWLEENAGAIDAINVFPVPDGDTGSNMSATLRAAREAAAGVADGAPAVLAAAASGALLGARGNSGVSLSQLLEGLARGAAEAGRLDGAGVAHALKTADSVARKAVTEPREGTILTVIADAATAASDTAAAGGDAKDVLMAGALGARASVQRTPDLLPVLKEAGVVDSGGLGLSVILDGFLAALTGIRAEPLVEPPRVGVGKQDVESAHSLGLSAGDDPFGYCTEFLVEGSFPEDSLREELRQLGTSLLVVGQSGLHRIHIHAPDPGAALSVGVRFGALSSIKIDNLDQQRRRPNTHLAPPTATVSVVAVAAGEGFQALFADYGVAVVRGGQSQNPSAAEIVAAIDGAPGAAVLVLPNNRNVISTAEQAAQLSGRDVRVIPTVSLPQGVAAALAFNPDRQSEENLAAMEQAARAVHTVEVTLAAKDATIDGVRAVKGQAIGIVDGKLAVADSSPEAAAVAAVDLIVGNGEVATVYYGADVALSRAEGCGSLLRARRPDLTVDVIYGGQPHYDYIVSIE
jgi:DAK2 domain fusion protein YloV